MLIKFLTLKKKKKDIFSSSPNPLSLPPNNRNIFTGPFFCLHCLSVWFFFFNLFALFFFFFCECACVYIYKKHPYEISIAILQKGLLHGSADISFHWDEEKRLLDDEDISRTPPVWNSFLSGSVNVPDCLITANSRR